MPFLGCGTQMARPVKVLETLHVRLFCRSLRSRLQFGIDTLHAIMLLAKYVQGGRKTVQTSK